MNPVERAQSSPQSVGQYLNIGEFFDKENAKSAPKNESFQKEREPFIDIPFWVLLLVPLAVAFVVLSSTASLRVLDTIFEKQIEGAVSAEIFLQLKEKYPQLSDSEVSALSGPKAKEAVDDLKKRGILEKQVREGKSKFMSKEGHPYLLEYDSYYYLRYARNILKNGHRGEVLQGSVPFDTLRRKPQGLGAEFSLLPFVEAYFFRVWSFFDGRGTLMESAFYLPVFLGVISVALVFFIAFIVTGDKLASAIGAFLFALHPFFFRQNMAGFTDTTILIMPLSLLCFFALALFLRDGIWLKFLAAALGFLALLALKYTWGGWYFVLGVMAGFFLACAVYSVWSASDSRSRAIRAVLFSLGGLSIGLFLWMFGYVEKVLRKFQITNELPGIDETVLELRSPDFSVWLDNFGGPLFAVFVSASIASLLFLISKKRASSGQIFILSWAAVLLLPAVIGNRFMFFLAPAVSILAGFALARVVVWIADFLSDLEIRPRNAVCVFVLVAIPAAVGASMIDIDTMPLPRMNAAIEKTGDWFQKNTGPGSIINTWWDFGYVWQYAAKRGTVLDAGPTDAAHWMSRAFLSQNESYAFSIFRMLNCAGHDGLDLYERRLGLSSGYVTEAVLRSDKAGAEKILSGLSAIDLLNVTHCEPPEAYVVVHRDILDVIPSISTISEWNETLGTVRELLMGVSQDEAVLRIAEELNLSSEDAEQIYFEAFAQDIKPPYGYVSPLKTCRSVKGDVFECWGFSVDFSSGEASKDGVRPRSVTVIRNGTKIVREYDGASTEYSLIVFGEEGVFKSLVASDAYVKSVLLRMYAKDSFEYFAVEHEEVDPERILVWRVNWAGKEKNESIIAVNASIQQGSKYVNKSR